MSNINEKKKFHFIYKTTNLINSKFYIGMHSTSNLKDGYLGSGKYLNNSIKKYGRENFSVEIFEYCESREKLIEREREIVNENLLKDGLCMNLILGGGTIINKDIVYKKNRTSGFTPEESKLGRIAANIACIKKYGNDWHSIVMKRYYSSLSEEEKIQRIQKIKDGKARSKPQTPSFLGKRHSDVTKQKMSDAKKGTMMGSNNSQFGTCWITKEKENKKIKLEELDMYISLNWIRGYNPSKK